jgi:catechol 2,3-dioxygenase-like lactoylglutathione lyase family enzyme
MPGILAIGHVGLSTRDLRRSLTFYREALGLKQVVATPYFNAFEVGDVHLCITPGEPRDVHFDFTSDDVQGMRKQLVAKGTTCSEVKHLEIAGHDCFSVRDPDGHEITIYSAHQRVMPEVGMPEL